MAARSRARAAARRRRNQASDLGARVWSPIPAVGLRDRHHRRRADWSSPLGVLALGIVCLHELFRMFEPLRPVKLAGFLGLIGLARGGPLRRRVPGPARRRGVVPLVFLLGLAMPDAAGRAAHLRHGRHARSASAGSASPSPTPSCCASCRTATGSSSTSSSGTFIGDTGAYLGGRAFGTRRLAPRDLAEQDGRGAGRSAWSARRWRCGAPASTRTGWPGGTRCCSGSPSALAAPLGDLFESKVKRDAGTKDAGTLFGAHGGALDRLDAALFTLVAGYYVWLALS